MRLVTRAAPRKTPFHECGYPQTYETGETSVKVHAVLRKIRIPYDRITVVRPSADTRSTLAMSLDRVLVEYDDGALLIAPDNQDAFFEDILKRATA